MSTDQSLQMTLRLAEILNDSPKLGNYECLPSNDLISYEELVSFSEMVREIFKSSFAATIVVDHHGLLIHEDIAQDGIKAWLVALSFISSRTFIKTEQFATYTHILSSKIKIIVLTNEKGTNTELNQELKLILALFPSFH
ncbi:hypothetical protein [Candidatus Lokiarchaeum ossiferum]|uniref:hypothetical protein n=1 Tax=Candidatus Lokiarchaeum ossiferum TaxID=2951803 RepID=UPI00352F0A8E